MSHRPAPLLLTRGPAYLVVAGINFGENIGSGVTVSGTVAAEEAEVDSADIDQAKLAAFEARPAPLVITDLRMPRLDGLALCGKLRADAIGNPARVVRFDEVFEHDRRVRPTRLVRGISAAGAAARVPVRRARAALVRTPAGGGRGAGRGSRLKRSFLI